MSDNIFTGSIDMCSYPMNEKWWRDNTLTELLGILGEGHGCAVVVGVHDPGLGVLEAKHLQLLLDHGVVALREVVVRFQAADGVVVAPVLAGMQGQVRRRAPHRQVPRHHQVHRAGFDQPLRSQCTFPLRSTGQCKIYCISE